MFDVKSLSTDELHGLVVEVQAELDYRGRVEASKVELDRVLTQFEAISEGRGAVSFEPVPHFGHAPGALILWEDAEYRNISGAFLHNHPGEYPIGWQQLTGLPDEVDEWVPGVEVVAGEIWAHEGHLYRVVQSHTTQAGWEPPNLPALWVKAGETDE